MSQTEMDSHKRQGMDQIHEIVGRYWVNHRLEHYANFFDEEWARETLAIAEPIPKLRPHFLDLCSAWKGTAGVARMPWMNIYQYKHFAESYQRYTDRLNDIRKLGLVMKQTLVKKLPGVSPIALNLAITEMVEDVCQQKVGTLEGTFDADEAWDYTFKNDKIGAYTFVLAWSQRICFTNLYYAYEDFIRQCLAAKLDEPDFNPGDIAGLRKQMAKHFRTDLMESCLNSQEVNIARCVRNALAHYGGRNIKQAVDSGHKYEVLDDVIQITALDNRALFHVLKVKVSELVAHIATMPEFQN